MALAEDQGQPGRGSEGGGQPRGETDLSTFIIGFNLAAVQLFNPTFLFRVIWNPRTCMST